MIKVMPGNLLNAQTDIIAHQTNCIGRMGAGVAQAIRNKYPHVFAEYQQFCDMVGSDALGKCLPIFTKSATSPKLVANLFGQLKTGKGATDYDALRAAMVDLRQFMAQYGHKSVAMPYMIGCGLGGGNWDIVYGIIQEVFADDDITVELCRLEDGQ